MDVPVFDSTRSAIVFAFNFSTAQYGEGVLGRLASRHAASGKGLVGMDGAGQAGMVLAAIWRLNDIERSAIVARFSVRTEPCPCCGGQRKSDLWRESIERLADRCVPAGVSNIRCRRELVARYFGAPGCEFARLADKYGINRKTIADQYRVMASWLEDVEARAQMCVDDAFKASGLVMAA